MEEARRASASEWFFDRADELNELLAQIEMRLQIVVVAGPTGCGKSALWKRLEELWKASPTLQARSPLFLIDMSKFSTPDSASAEIVKQVRNWSRGRPGFHGLLDDVMPGDNSISAVLTAFRRVAYQNAGVKPVVILDDADKLKGWDAYSYDSYLQCFIAMTKQDERCAVILSSSNGLFVPWIALTVGCGRSTYMDIGYFDKDKAKLFFLRCLPREQHEFLDDAKWEQIFDVCGGCPSELKICADRVYNQGMELEEVLHGMVDAVTPAIAQGVAGSLEQGGWEGSKFRQIMEMIVKNDGAARRYWIFREIFNSDRRECMEQVDALVEANMLHLRFVPKDYKELAEGPFDDCDILMARSPPHLKAMKRWLLDPASET